jgi:hypothetical protein
MATGVWSSVVTTKNTFTRSANSLICQILGLLGQLPRTAEIFFSQFLDEHRVDWKAFARGGHYSASDWMTGFPIWSRATQRALRASGRLRESLKQ